jgi:hypothetical protein
MSGSHNVNDCENAADGLNILGGSDNGSGNQVGITLSYCCVLLLVIIGCYYVATNSSLNLYCSLHVSSIYPLSSAYLNPNPEPWAEAFVLLVRCMLGYACPYVHFLFTSHSL